MGAEGEGISERLFLCLNFATVGNVPPFETRRCSYRQVVRLASFLSACCDRFPILVELPKLVDPTSICSPGYLEGVPVLAIYFFTFTM